MNFDQYRPAPDIAPGLYDLPCSVPDEIVQQMRTPGARAPKTLFEQYFEFLILLDPKCLFKHFEQHGYDAYTYLLYELGGGGYVNIYVVADNADITDEYQRHFEVYATYQEAFSALAKAMAVDARYQLCGNLGDGMI